MRIRNKILLIILPLLVFISDICAQNILVLGEFKISRIIDGDTFRFEGLDRPARLLGIDTEEIYYKPDAEARLKEISANWREYYAHKRDSSGKPAKIESPFGHQTREWTIELFRDVTSVRLEYDDSGRTVDMYDRYLVYAIAIKNDGTEFNYNIECVKQGYSPYFNKYGNSTRFHEEFLKAQEYASVNKLGIWSGSELCYPDYEERVKWWSVRAGQLMHFDSVYAGRPGHYSLRSSADFESLKRRVNDSVTVFGSISRLQLDIEPQIVFLEASREKSIELVFFQENRALIAGLDLDNPVDFYIYAKGILNEYNGRYQIKIEGPEQIWRE